MQELAACGRDGTWGPIAGRGQLPVGLRMAGRQEPTLGLHLAEGGTFLNPASSALGVQELGAGGRGCRARPAWKPV